MIARRSSDEILAERARLLAMPRDAHEESVPADLLDLLVFTIDGERLAFPLGVVSAILRAPVVTPLPRAVAPVFGVTVSRGRALTVLSLYAGRAAGPAARQLIVIGDGHRVTVGVLADDVDETRSVSRTSLAPAPSGARRGMSLGVTSDAVLVLDTSALLAQVTADA
jgi:chemotaxis signal transduction protein